MTTKHRRFRVTATVTFPNAITMTQARHALSKAFDKSDLWLSIASNEPDAKLRGPFKATPFPKQVKRK